MSIDRADAGWPAAIIAGAYQTGVLAVRGLQRRNVRALCFDCNPAFPGFRSRYGKAHLCPDPDAEPSKWLEFMTTLAGTQGHKPVLIASSDNFVSAISRHASELRKHFVFTSSAALHGELADKDTQYELATRHGMPMPKSSTVHSMNEVRSFASRADYPCLMKPLHFREWQRFPEEHPLYDRKVAIAERPDDLIAYYQSAMGVTPTVVLQEIIQGEDTQKRVYVCCHSENGQRLGYAIFRALRCDPMGFGPASVTELVSDPEVARICNEFLSNIGYTGICEIEMKRDVRGGPPRLIEVNPRLSGGGDAAPYAGVETAWLHYLSLIGQPVEPVAPKVEKFRHIVLRADAKAIPAYWVAGKLTLGDLFRSYSHPRAFFDVDWKDPRYTFETLLISLRSFAARIVLTLLRKRFK